tara:strand:- start:132 stop:692 length:561 start_codon:yes stop_codon:yes gene_type:complete
MIDNKKAALFIGVRYEAFRAFYFFCLKKKINNFNVLTTENSLLNQRLIISNNDNINLKLYKSSKKNEALSILESLVDEINFELILSSGFHFLIPNRILKKNSLFINSHPHILPNWKGINPIKNSLKNGEKYFGVTLHFINERMDDGKIIKIEKVKINNPELEVLYELLFTIVEPITINSGLNKIYR